MAVFDEFEKSKHISTLLETMKLSNRGGVVTSGTTGDKPKEFELNHMPWFASIYLPRSFSSDQAQTSRAVRFELGKVPEGKSIVGLTDEQAETLLCEIIAATLSSWESIEKAAQDIEKRKGEFIKACDGKISGRCVENLMYAMALIGLVKGKAQQIPEWAITEMKDDGENILETIIFAKIRHDGHEYLITDLIDRALREPVLSNISEAVAKDLLRKHGLSVVERREGWCLAVIPKMVNEHLLKHYDEYRGLDIKSPLERLDGVEKNVKTSWGSQTKVWAMQIPGKHISALTSAEG